MSYTLRVGTRQELGRVYRQMRRDFHAYERMPRLTLVRAMDRGQQELLLLEENGNPAGYAICCHPGRDGYVLLNYLAVDSTRRGSGAGSAFLREICRRYAAQQGLIIELTETPGEGGDTLRRERFYRRAGAETVASDYRLCGVPTRLMVIPLSGPADISGRVHEILPEIYRRSMAAWVVKKIIDIRPVSGPDRRRSE